MKIYFAKILLLAITLVAFGCSDEEGGSGNPRLEVEEDAFSFDDAVSHTLAIKANGHWKAEVIRDSSEFIISPAEGKGNGEVTITLNRSKTDQISGYLKVTHMDGTDDDGLEVTCGVKLLASKLDMGISPRNVTLTSPHAKETLQIKMEGQWTATLSDFTWCSIDRRKGEGNGSILLSLRDGITLDEGSTELILVQTAHPRIKYVVQIDLKIDRSNSKYTHGEYVVLNKAKVGAGIDIVFCGEGFTKKDLGEGGKWQQAMEKGCDFIFRHEPFKSYRDYFNLYAIAVACPDDMDLYSSTNSYETELGIVYGPDKVDYVYPTSYINIYDYAYNNTPVKEDKGTLKNMLVGLVINSDRIKGGSYGGFCMTAQRDDFGMACAPIAMFVKSDLTGTFTHELLGHGFAGFGDEYFWEEVTFPTDQIEVTRNMQRQGRQLNVEVTNNPKEFINQNWAKLLEMDYSGVGMVEGGLKYSKGVWRVSDKSCMGSGGSADYYYYNPVQREVILRKIYELSGKGTEYNLDVFLEYDKKNQK